MPLLYKFQAELVASTATEIGLPARADFMADGLLPATFTGLIAPLPELLVAEYEHWY